jgi:hypothetical protein
MPSGILKPRRTGGEGTGNTMPPGCKRKDFQFEQINTQNKLTVKGFFSDVVSNFHTIVTRYSKLKILMMLNCFLCTSRSVYKPYLRPSKSS